MLAAAMRIHCHDDGEILHFDDPHGFWNAKLHFENTVYFYNGPRKEGGGSANGVKIDGSSRIDVVGPAAMNL